MEHCHTIGLLVVPSVGTALAVVARPGTRPWLEFAAVPGDEVSVAGTESSAVAQLETNAVVEAHTLQSVLGGCRNLDHGTLGLPSRLMNSC